MPFLDIGLIFFWVPGVILFLFGYPLIFGWWSMLLLPITLLIFGFLRRWQERHVFRRLGVEVGKDVARVRRLPARLPGADLGRVAEGLRAVPRRWRPPLVQAVCVVVSE